MLNTKYCACIAIQSFQTLIFSFHWGPSWILIWLKLFLFLATQHMSMCAKFVACITKCKYFCTNLLSYKLVS